MTTATPFTVSDCPLVTSIWLPTPKLKASIAPPPGTSKLRLVPSGTITV